MFEKYLTKTGRLSCTQPQEIKNQWYTKKFQEIHGDVYDYYKVEYKTSREKVVIICKEHGEFLQTPNTHLKGHGCPGCSHNKKKDTTQCIKDFEEVHGSTYDYQKVQYVNANYDVEIGCRVHGSFFQRPNHHLEGHGCPRCQINNQNTLYILKCLTTGLIKIGITNNLDNRISRIGGNLKYLYHITIDNPRDLEKQLHQKYKDWRVFNPTVRSGGTEFFQLPEEQLSQLIESLKIA